MGLFDAFSSSGGEKNARKAYALQSSELKKGREQSEQQLRAGYEDADPYLAKAQELFGLIQPQQQAGYDMYQGALGLRGQEGYDQAAGAFRNTPGYDFALQQANQNVMRNQAATGGLNSGGTLMALSDRAQGLQNQEWNNWLDRLQGFDPMRGATAQANILGNRANMRYGLGQDIAGVYGNFSPRMAQAGYDQFANINNAQQTANANSWGAALGLLNLGTGLAGLV